MVNRSMPPKPNNGYLDRHRAFYWNTQLSDKRYKNYHNARFKIYQYSVNLILVHPKCDNQSIIVQRANISGILIRESEALLAGTMLIDSTSTLKRSTVPWWEPNYWCMKSTVAIELHLAVSFPQRAERRWLKRSPKISKIQNARFTWKNHKKLSMH